jgi:hypothetical protein
LNLPTGSLPFQWNSTSALIVYRTDTKFVQSIDPATIIHARSDLAARLGVSENEIVEGQIERSDFPDAALGAPVADEMSAQVITPGWRIRLKAGADTYEYRATTRQLRLVNFKGQNYRV